MILDIEVNYLQSDAGKRWEELSHDRQSSLLAYWMLHHSTKDERVMLSRPANYHDLIQGLMLSRGIKPCDAAGGKTPKGFKGKGAPPIKRAARSTNVVGGELTPAIEMAASAFRRQSMPKHMARKTGSSPEAVDWLLSHRID